MDFIMPKLCYLSISATLRNLHLKSPRNMALWIIFVTKNEVLNHYFNIWIRNHKQKPLLIPEFLKWYARYCLKYTLKAKFQFSFIFILPLWMLTTNEQQHPLAELSWYIILVQKEMAWQCHLEQKCWEADQFY